MLRICALTVFGETDSSPAISGRDRFVGRYRRARGDDAAVADDEFGRADHHRAQADTELDDQAMVSFRLVPRASQTGRAGRARPPPSRRQRQPRANPADQPARDRGWAVRLFQPFSSSGSPSDSAPSRTTASERCSTPAGPTGESSVRSLSGDGATPPDSDEPDIAAARRRNRWSAACAYARGARLTSGNSGGGWI